MHALELSDAISFITFAACLSTPLHTTGIPGFIIPAFSVAIFSIVSPNIAVCSSDIVDITDISGCFTALVASSLPPSPVSITT